ncbi:MAG: ABC transporter permease subunit [Anaerolineaceae bacterium]|nr:ABC transporter permease subunit [Anaerolineaceae bacterium]
MEKKWHRRNISELIIKILMAVSFAIVICSLGMIVWTVLSKGLPALTLDMITKTPKGGYYLGKEGGILNAILGSLLLASGGTILALLFSLPTALFLETYSKNTIWGSQVRLALDVLWGIPSIVYGAFGFIIMLAIGLRASLLGGILTLALLELPIMTRAMDEVIRQTPRDLTRAALALGVTKAELAFQIIVRQTIPGMVTAVLLAFGRGIGDAASVLFTAGYTDRIPNSLLRPAASLPLAVFFQLSVPFPEVQQRAYASALILTFLVLFISIISRLIAWRMNKFTIK